MAAQVTAVAVSRRLARKYTRSTTHASRIKGYPLVVSGFTVSAGSGGGAFVEWCPGERRFAEDSTREKVMRNNLLAYKEYLDQWYVTEIQDAVFGGPYLSVLCFHTKD